MIATSVIRSTVANALAGAGFSVKGEEGGQEALPLVCVSLTPLTLRAAGGGKQLERGMLVDCAYYNETPTESELYGALDRMTEALLPAVSFEGRHITAEKVRSDLVDQVAHLMFELNFYDSFGEAEELPAMGELKLKQEVKQHGST